MQNKLNFAQAIKLGFQNYAVFRGVASRAEFWYFALFCFLVNIVLSVLDSLISKLGHIDSPVTLGNIFALAVFLPQLSLAARRFKDAGFSAQWLWVQVIPAAVLVASVIAILNDPGVQSIVAMAAQNYQPTDAELQQVLSMIDPTIFTGLWISMVLGLAWGIFQLVVETKATKTRPQGNKYAPELEEPFTITTD